MKKKEAPFTIKFGKWLEDNPPEKTTVYEIKVIKKESFSLSKWIKEQPHQARGLLKAKGDGCYHKISDQSQRQKPFDCFFIKKAESKMVFYSETEKEFVIVDAKKIIDLALSGQKSIKFQDIKII